MSYENYFEVEPGVEIYYVDKGEGTPIIFVPGLTFSSEMFEHQIEYFSKNYRVIAVDPRSQGHSTITVHGNDYETHSRDLVKLVEYLELKDIILVGWSTGTLETLGYLEQAGLLNVKGLFNIDMSPRPMSLDSADWVEGSLYEVSGLYSAFFHSPEDQKEFVKMYATEIMVQRELTQHELFNFQKQSLHTPYYI
jgi:pimeloyl-ACP methyl ester carboxylesterase